MGYPLELALRYLRSKKRAFVSVGTAFAILGVALGVAALATAMSVTGGFQAVFREKVLGVNAHVIVLKGATFDFREYRAVMEQVSGVPGVVGVAPFTIDPMMLTHGDATATGVLVKGVDPSAGLGLGPEPLPRGARPVLVLPQQIVGCEKILAEQGAGAATRCGQEKLRGLRLPGAKPAGRTAGKELFDLDPGARPPPPRPPAADPGAAPKAGEARSAAPAVPRGDVTPAGGYTSTLPEDDAVLPPDVDTDPCSAPAGAAMPGIVVGVSLAETLGAKIGDCVTVTSPTIGFSFSGSSLKAPVARRFRVIALFQAGFSQYDEKLVYTDLYEAQHFGDLGDDVRGVEMIVDDIDRAHEIAAQIHEMLGASYDVTDWEKLNRGLFTALLIQQIGMSIVLALIIVVAAFTVVATLIMVVLEKKKEIAVMKAMGATDDAILRIFLYQGGIIGLVGTSFGLLLGLGACEALRAYRFPLDAHVYFISSLPVLIRPAEFALAGGVAIVICLAATIVPSLYAARLRPADGFRAQ